MQLTYTNNQIKIDNGDHYYIGLIKKESFPENLRSDFEDIIDKSFINFSDDNYTVIHSISDDHKEYLIDFKFICKPVTIRELIKINLIRHDKDFKDYINERIEKLEKENVLLKEKVSELAGILLKKDEEDEEQGEEETEEQSEEQSEQEQSEPEETKYIKGKAVTKKIVSEPKISESEKKPLKGGRGKAVYA
jgi:hypothetical protein